MIDFLRAFYSRISDSQRATLLGLSETAKSGWSSSLSLEEIRARLSQVGTQISKVSEDQTDPQEFNRTVIDILTDLAAIYTELDNIGTANRAGAQLISSELDRLASAVQDMESRLRQAKELLSLPYTSTHNVFETFSTKEGFESSPRYYGSRAKAWVDPLDYSLRLEPVSSFSRTITKSGLSLARVQVSNTLGRSVDGRHSVGDCIDGNMDTIWQEVIHSDQRIFGDRSSAPWLPSTYAGGAAVRLKVSFEKPTAISDVYLRLASAFPMQLLQVAWDNPSHTPSGMLPNEGFETNAAGWEISPSGGNASGPKGATGWICSTGYCSLSGLTLEAPSYDPIGSCSDWTTIPVVAYTPSGSSSGTMLVSGSAANSYYTLELDAMRSRRQMVPEAGIQWMNASGASVLMPSVEANERVLIDNTPGVWKHYTMTASPPPDAVWCRVFLWTGAHSGQVWFDNIKLYRSASFVDLYQESQSVLSTQLVGCECENLYITLAQRNFVPRVYTVPRSQLTTYRLWESIVAPTEGDVSDDQYTSNFTTEEDFTTSPLQDYGNSLAKTEAVRMGGMAHRLVSELSDAGASDTVSTSVLEYRFGVRELDLLYREHREDGIFVSKPVGGRGEVREVRLIPNVRQYSRQPTYKLLLRDSDDVADARLFPTSNLLKIYASTDREVGSSTTSDDVVVQPLRRIETYKGTDWSGRLYLNSYPYVDAGRIDALVLLFTSGAPSGYNATPYDPNAESPIYYTSNGLRSCAGYRPISVSLKFPNGEIAKADTIGRPDVGDVGYVESEYLISTVDYVTTTTTTEAKDTASSNLAKELLQEQSKKYSQTEVRRQEVRTCTTRYSPILAGKNGAMLSVYWTPYGSEGPTQSDALIPPANVDVDVLRGVIRIKETPPSDDMGVRASYYYQIRTGVPSGTTLAVSGLVTSGFTSISYPVTRNVTDYVTGTKPTLQRYVSNTLDPEYYPIYDYYQSADGSLVFAEDLSMYGDTPAEVVIEYDTLDLNPRLVVELSRHGDATQTPIIDDYTLLLSLRSVPSDEVL